jgi:hypothetical protein
MLFPVISATDDLRAMQPETEESTPGRRVFRSAENEKDHLNGIGTTPALLTVAGANTPLDEFRGLVIATPLLLPAPFLLAAPTGRAPPILPLS